MAVPYPQPLPQQTPASSQALPLAAVLELSRTPPPQAQGRISGIPTVLPGETTRPPTAFQRPHKGMPGVLPQQTTGLLAAALSRTTAMPASLLWRKAAALAAPRRTRAPAVAFRYLPEGMPAALPRGATPASLVDQSRTAMLPPVVRSRTPATQAVPSRGRATAQDEQPQTTAAPPAATRRTWATPVVPSFRTMAKTVDVQCQRPVTQVGPLGRKTAPLADVRSQTIGMPAVVPR